MPSFSVRSFGSAFLRVVLVGCVLLSVACGGRDTGDDDGGGGGGGGGTGTAPITAGTAEATAGAVMRAVVISAFLPDAVDGAIPPDLGALQAPDDEVPGRDIPATSNRAAFGPNLVACNVSGDVDLEGDVADTMTYTQGDLVMADYMACDFGVGHILDLAYDGIMDFTITTLTGDLLSASYDTTLDVLFDTWDDLLEVVSGNATIDIDTTGDPLFVYGTSATSLSIDDNGDTYALTDFATDMEFDESGSPEVYSFTSDGDMTGSEFTGSVSFTTIADFVGDFPATPSTGEMRIFGLSNASIRVQPQNATDVLLRLDLDGNGSIDDQVVTTWTLLGF